ncbi:hypothetical protein [Salinisphaera japonica]|uniref:Uncharacterized protein n=1 Tax=Salinisphaera japonica YTM-1 TaxID=1209778 RepID=A0A423Q1I8_9GAMM|nr:hypothetical protein [Salinisphaera japonica]ROO31979.1 hypothetical protein SAJA_02070 [Salinisphaera japonica YTM-1]
MASPVNQFRDLIEALEVGPEVPGDVAAWLHDGCVRFATGETRSLDAALGLRGQGINRPASQYALETRDAELIAALNLIDGKSDRARCKELRRQIAAFDSRTWPRVRAYHRPPDRLTPIQAHLFHAFKTGQHMPEAGRLAEIARRNPLFSSCKKDGIMEGSQEPSGS